MSKHKEDRRRQYDLRVGEEAVRHQQCLSNSRRLMREFATDSEVIELLEIYFSGRGKGSPLKKLYAKEFRGNV